MLWLWVLAGVTVWLVLGVLVALTVGRAVRIADERSPHARLPAGFSTADLPAELTAPALAPAPAPAPAHARRGPVPLPPVGVGLVLLVLALETAGYVTRLTGTRGALADALSMDAPFSVPRLFVAGLFAVSAIAAVTGAGLQSRRRTWWLAVGLVGAAIAAVKAGSTLHSTALAGASALIGSTGALVLSALLAAGTVGSLWYLSRDERRDRRRVLSALSLYAFAVVGLSALSSTVGQTYGAQSNWAAAATFVEESGEALGGVAYLVAVLVGVAPQLALPASWPLRRRADAELEAASAPAAGATPAQRGWSPSR